jgi:sulfonate transport system permease protein
MSLDTDTRAAQLHEQALRAHPATGRATLPPQDALVDGRGRAGEQVPRRPGRLRSLRVTDLLLALAVPTVLVVDATCHATTGVLDQSRFSAPGDVLAAGLEYARSGRLWPNLGISLQRVLGGFALGALAAVLVGVLVSLSSLADRLLSPLLSAVRAVPSLAWVPLLILWLGIGEQPKVLLVAIGAFFPVLATLVAGIRQVDTGLLEVAQAYGLSWRQRVTTVLLPSAAPSLLAGARLGLNQAWLFLVAAELIASTAGLGWQLQNAQRNGQVELLLATIILFAVLGKATDGLLGLVERRVLARLR